MSNSVVWFGVLRQDADKLRAFYSNLPGWKFNLDPETKYGIVEVGEGLEGHPVGLCTPRVKN